MIALAICFSFLYESTFISLKAVKESSPIFWFILQMPATAVAWLGQEVQIPRWVLGSQLSEPSLLARRACSNGVLG